MGRWWWTMVKSDQSKEIESDLTGTAGAIGQLTVGERQCLELVASGMVSKEIARSLDVSPHTVDARLRVAARKLGARNRFVAAQILNEFLKNGGNSSSQPISNLIYEDLSLPENDPATKMDGPAGDGNDPVDLRSDPLFDNRDDVPSLHPVWLKPSHPFAKFFGGENKLSVGRRLLLIMGIAIGTAMAFTAVVNSLIGLSQLLSSPP
ncbi:helix-turn-helix domain-containing protein [Sphingopyxis yananensis]|uniref:helix-turn-helix domain-containing protein n=1 Tax=Sphingopyxis yananensis TaxID=2886687 RepID=UPI002A5A0C64|nr:helix-turn-helix transcriptional regulator [Sphingopyxis yananensis]